MKDQLKWVGLMESCHHQVEEIILTELVYSERYPIIVRFVRLIGRMCPIRTHQKRNMKKYK